MSQPKHYTASDIERYHSGQLSAAEMHALEKAALDDPFLADALEGYAVAKTPAADLSVLQQKLQLRIEKEPKRRGLFYIGAPWMRVAALFILLAGGGWLVVNTFLKTDQPAQNELATNQQAKEKIEAVTPKSPEDDSTSTVFNAPSGNSFDNEEPGMKSSAPAKRPVEKKQLNTASETSRGYIAPAEPVIVQNAPQPALERPQYKEEARFADSALQGRVAGIAAMQAATDSAAYQRDVAAVQKNNAANAARALAARPDTLRNVNVVLQPAEGSLAEVVVINKNKAERKDIRSRMQPKIDTLEPAEGWGYFDDYIANNLKQPEELKTKPLSGEVELAFDINKNGEPVNITIVKSLCQKCDEEAIRLLREGPKWKKGKNKGKVKIRF